MFTTNADGGCRNDGDFHLPKGQRKGSPARSGVQNLSFIKT